MPEKSPLNNSSEELKRYLIEQNVTKANLKKIIEDLQSQLQKIGDILSEQDQIWSTHREKYNTFLAGELEEQHEITLTTEEKAELNSTNAAAIKEKTERLKKLEIKIPKNSSDFAISALDVVFAALSRKLEKPENINKTIKKLPAIKEENAAAETIRSQFAETHTDMMATIEEYKKQITGIKGLSEAELNKLSEINDVMRKITQRPDPAPKQAEISNA